MTNATRIGFSSLVKVTCDKTSCVLMSRTMTQSKLLRHVCLAFSVFFTNNVICQLSKLQVVWPHVVLMVRGGHKTSLLVAHSGCAWYDIRTSYWACYMTLDILSLVNMQELYSTSIKSHCNRTIEVIPTFNFIYSMSSRSQYVVIDHTHAVTYTWSPCAIQNVTTWRHSPTVIACLLPVTRINCSTTQNVN